MQVKSLFIKDFQQFKDFELDLTYPAGHELAGQPLKKVCIIGQSGTGKTTLLRFLQEMTDLDRKYFDGKVSMEKPQILKYSNRSRIILNIGNTILECEILDKMNGIRYDGALVNYITSERPRNQWHYIYDRGLNVTEILTKKKIKNIFIPADVLYKHNELFGTPNIFNILKLNSVDFSKIHLGELKMILLKSYNYDHFQETLIQKRNEFAKLATNPNTSAKQLTEEAQKLREWEEQQENPLKKLGEEFLDRILNHFNLRVKTEVDFQDIGFIKLETLQGEPVESDIWSTGTKQVILTALPFYALKPENCIILFDEPERSLYPDIQTKIIDFYTSLAPSSQFFFATHSPLIAAGFEPWEIVELKFNEAGKVYREQYYEGENHVDNYTVDPRYLAYDSILKNVFDMSERSNEKRTEGLMRLSMLEKRLEKLNGQNPEEKEKVWKEYEKLAKKLDWKLK